MARLSRDILRACVRNTELAQKSVLENSENGFILADFETKSHSLLPGITESFDLNESSELSLGIYMKDLKKDVKVGKENLNVFEEILASDEKRSFTEKVEANELIIVSSNNLCNSKNYLYFLKNISFDFYFISNYVINVK